MEKISFGPLDRLPAWLRHAIIVFVAAFLGDLLPVVWGAFSSGGFAALSVLDWSGLLVDALEDSITATVTASGVLGLTPLTRQYGVGASKTLQAREVDVDTYEVDVDDEPGRHAL